MSNFKPYYGHTGHLPTNKDYLNYRWFKPGCRILFSVTRQGNAVACHFASDKQGLRHLKEAIRDWCEFVFYIFDWCEMIIAKIIPRSVGKLAVKCGFEKSISVKDVNVYIRSKK